MCIKLGYHFWGRNNLKIIISGLHHRTRHRTAHPAQTLIAMLIGVERVGADHTNSICR
jgi:hypothetical protein